MKDYFLVYEINDYPEDGGGIHYKDFKNKYELLDEVNRLNKEFENDFKIVRAGIVRENIKIVPVEKVTKYEFSNSR